MTRRDSITDARPSGFSPLRRADTAGQGFAGARIIHANRIPACKTTTADTSALRMARRAARRVRKFCSTRTNFCAVVLALLALLYAAASPAQDNYRQQMKGLDEQVQEIKADVLGIAAELVRLEERLLYPSNTHLAVFVALAERDTLRLDAVKIQIDGQPVAHSIYSFKELEALQKGGVQRIYTGNVATGEHQIEVTIVGKLDTGKEYNRTERFAFSKGVEPKLLGVTLGSSQLQLGDW